VDADLAPQLRRQGMDALSVYDLHQQGRTDVAILEYAASQQRVLLTHDIRHFLELHQQYAAEGLTHAGILLTNERYIGRLIQRLITLAEAVTAEEMREQVKFI